MPLTMRELEQQMDEEERRLPAGASLSEGTGDFFLRWCLLERRSDPEGFYRWFRDFWIEYYS